MSESDKRHLGCGTPSGKHIFENCSCAEDGCYRWVCVWCELVVDPT